MLLGSRISMKSTAKWGMRSSRIRSARRLDSCDLDWFEYFETFNWVHGKTDGETKLSCRVLETLLVGGKMRNAVQSWITHPFLSLFCSILCSGQCHLMRRVEKLLKFKIFWSNIVLKLYSGNIVHSENTLNQDRRPFCGWLILNTELEGLLTITSYNIPSLSASGSTSGSTDVNHWVTLEITMDLKV